MNALEMNTAINNMLKTINHIEVIDQSQPSNIKVSVLEVDRDYELYNDEGNYEDFSGATEGDR